MHNFPIQIPPPNGLRTVQYESLKQLNGMLHWELDPVVSQKSIFGKSLGYLARTPYLLPQPSLAPPFSYNCRTPGMAKEVAKRREKEEEKKKQKLSNRNAIQKASDCG